MYRLRCRARRSWRHVSPRGHKCLPTLINRQEWKAMVIDEANAVIDRLNDVFAGNGSDIPLAQEIYDALLTLNQAVTDIGQAPSAIPSNIKKDSAVINKTTADIVKQICDLANKMIAIDKEKKEIEA